MRESAYRKSLAAALFYGSDLTRWTPLEDESMDFLKWIYLAIISQIYPSKARGSKKWQSQISVANRVHANLG